METAPKAKTVIWDFLIPSVLGGRGSACLCKYNACVQIYSIKHWSSATVPVPLLKCSLAALCPPAPAGLPAQGFLQPGINAAFFLWRQRVLTHARTGTRADGQGLWGHLCRGYRDSRHLAWHCIAWSTLQEGFSGVGSLPQPEAVWNHAAMHQPSSMSTEEGRCLHAGLPVQAWLLVKTSWWAANPHLPAVYTF